jgi:hypothetical protein
MKTFKSILSSLTLSTMNSYKISPKNLEKFEEMQKKAANLQNHSNLHRKIFRNHSAQFGVKDHPQKIRRRAHSDGQLLTGQKGKLTQATFAHLNPHRRSSAGYYEPSVFADLPEGEETGKTDHHSEKANKKPERKEEHQQLVTVKGHPHKATHHQHHAPSSKHMAPIGQVHHHHQPPKSSAIDDSADFHDAFNYLYNSAESHNPHLEEEKLDANKTVDQKAQANIHGDNLNPPPNVQVFKKFSKM